MTTTAAQTRDRATLGRKMLNKVPEVTIFFWVIKIMCTTVGETAADYLNDNLGFGLTKTTYVTGALLIVLLAVQFRLRRYVPGVYWSVVVVISVFGTLITDNMTDRYNVPLTTSTIVFSIVLAAVFAGWYARRADAVDPHHLHHPPRGLLLAGDPLHLRAGHRGRRPRRPRSSTSATPSRSLIFGGLIAAVAIAHYAFGLNAVLSFWLAYILTRPLGASIGDEMSQNSHKYGGLGLGTTGTSYIFLGCILALVAYLTITRKDATETRRSTPLARGRLSVRRAPSRGALPGPLLRDHRRQGQAEVGDAVGQVEVQPARDRVRQRGEDDLVEVLVVERLLDGVHRIVAGRDRAVRRAPAAGLLDERQGERQHLLALGHVRMRHLGRVAQVRVVRIGDEEVKPGRTAGRPLADRVQERGRGRRLVRDHQDARRSSRLPWDLPSAVLWSDGPTGRGQRPFRFAEPSRRLQAERRRRA